MAVFLRLGRLSSSSLCSFVLLATMATNYCSASLSVIHRTSTVWAKRSCLPLERYMILSQNNAKLSYHLAPSAIPNLMDQRKITIDRNYNCSILQRQQYFYPTHVMHNILGRVRCIVMVTQTVSSEVDDEENKIAVAATESSSDNIQATHAEESGIALTTSCASRIRQLASTRLNPDAVYLRLYVDAGGCSGFQYKFLLLSEDNRGNPNSLDDDGEEEDGTIDAEEDVVFEKDGMRVVIDQTSLELLRGSTIDYVQEMIRSSFAVVKNPQSESACGCGSSFAVKSFNTNPALD